MSNQGDSLLSIVNELNVSFDNIKRWKKEFNQGKSTVKVTQVKYKFIQSCKYDFSAGKMCCVFKVSKSRYYKWFAKGPSKRVLQHQKKT